MGNPLFIMHDIAHLKIEDLKLSKPQTLDGGLTLSNINHSNDRKAIIQIHGEAISEPEYGPEEFGAPLSFWFKPDNADALALESIDEVLKNGGDNATRLGEQLGLNVADYEWKSCFNDDSYVRMKLKFNDQGNWKFHSNQKFTANDMSDHIKPQVRMTAIVNLGFYFSEDKNYGLYLTPKYLNFDDVKKSVPDNEIEAFLKSNENARKTGVPKRNNRKVVAPV